MTATGAVIVTYRSAGRLTGSLASLQRHEDSAVIVVDSGSPESPPDVGARVLALGDNVGFGPACNVGANCLLAANDDMHYLAFLNPDVFLQGPSISQLAAGMQTLPDVGIATGPVVDEHGQRQTSAWGPTSSLRAFWFATGWQLFRLRRLLGRLRLGGALTSAVSLARDQVEVDGHVLGGAMVVRRECWEQLGGFDEDFFLYWEDADLCQRARDLGWKVAVLPCTPIVHEAGTSSAGVTDTQRWQWYVEGAALFADKHLTPWQKRKLMGALHVGRILRRRK